MQRKQVPIAALQFGMYIAELDRPWTDTPFMFQGFCLRTAQQLEALQRFCRHVFVDLARSEPAATRQATPLAAQATGPGFQLRGTACYPATADVQAELAHAASIHAESISELRNVFLPLEKGSGVFDTERVKNVVKRLSDSVVRNPDALLLLAKMQGSGIGAHATALQVCLYTMVFARFLALERDEIWLLGMLGLLQDVGKARLPAVVLDKPEPLTMEEMEIIRKHVELSGHILGAASALPSKLAPLALLHHERQNGTGYPRGLKAYQIGLYGSMAAICDAYAAMLSERPYRPAQSHSTAVNVLLNDRGAVFHTQLVEEFIRCRGAFPVGSVVELSSGEIGIVIAENCDQRLKPTVRVVRDASGNEIRVHEVRDLADATNGRRGEAYRVRRTLHQHELQLDPRQLFTELR